MKNIIKIIAGIFIVLMAILGYCHSVEHMYQLTFISNTSCGLVLLADGLIGALTDKKVPVLIYQIVMLCTNVVFFTCVFTLFGWHSFNFSGAFFFLHAIDPPLFLAIYLFCTELGIKSKTDRIRRIFISPVMIMCYLLFDYIRFRITGELVYGLISPESLTLGTAILIGTVFYLLMAFMSYGLIDLKLYIQKKTDKHEKI